MISNVVDEQKPSSSMIPPIMKQPTGVFVEEVINTSKEIHAEESAKSQEEV